MYRQRAAGPGGLLLAREPERGERCPDLRHRLAAPDRLPALGDAATQNGRGLHNGTNRCGAGAVKRETANKQAA